MSRITRKKAKLQRHNDSLSIRTRSQVYLVQVCLPFLVIFPLLGFTMAYDTFPIVTVTLRDSSPFTNQLAIGATYTQENADEGGDGEAVASARQLMQTSLSYQNQQIMGWGTDDPEPAPGVYNWSSLDHRVQTMRATRARIVLTLCCAPGWMRPQGYQDDWKYLGVAPAASHIEDFAHLAVPTTCAMSSHLCSK